MSDTFLDKIFAAKKLRVEAAKLSCSLATMMELALEKRAAAANHRFRSALQDSDHLNIIAEFKRASPSKGVINGSVDVVTIAGLYERGGAAAISVLTEEDFFKGSLDDLRAVRHAVDLPILRKDFIFEAFQIYEAAEAGADAILLIAAMLDDEVLVELRNLAEVTLGLDVLVEVHTLDELARVKNLGMHMIGVNNRDLRTFNVTLDVSRDLINHMPKDAVMIAESGLRTHDDLVELHKLGYAGFLIGETLMRSGDPESALKMLAEWEQNPL